MKTSKEMLSSVLKTTQMGQLGIRSVLNVASTQELRRALNAQLREYDEIESQAHALASQRGWELSELDPGLRMMTDLMTRMSLKFGDTDPQIASMMVEGNTKGMIKGLKNLHQFPGNDVQISALSQKLIDTETANIRQMQAFL